MQVLHQNPSALAPTFGQADLTGILLVQAQVGWGLGSPGTCSGSALGGSGGVGLVPVTS